MQQINDDEDALKLVDSNLLNTLWSTSGGLGAAGGPPPKAYPLWLPAPAAAATAGTSTSTNGRVWATYFGSSRNTAAVAALESKASTGSGGGSGSAAAAAAAATVVAPLDPTQPWKSPLLRNISSFVSFPLSLAHQLQTNPVLAHVLAGTGGAANADGKKRECVIHIVGADASAELHHPIVWNELLHAIGRNASASSGAPTSAAAGTATTAAAAGTNNKRKADDTASAHTAATAASTGDDKRQKKSDSKSSSAADKTQKTAESETAANSTAPIESHIDHIRVIFIGPELDHSQHGTYSTLVSPQGTVTMTCGYFRGSYHSYVKTKEKKGAAADKSGSGAAGAARKKGGAAVIPAQVRFTLPHVIVGFQLGLTCTDYDWSESQTAMQRVLHANFYKHSAATAATDSAAAPTPAAADPTPAPAPAPAADASAGFSFPTLSFGAEPKSTKRAKSKDKTTPAAGAASAAADDSKAAAPKQALFSPLLVTFSNSKEEMERERDIWIGAAPKDGEDGDDGMFGGGGGGGADDDGDEAMMKAILAAAAGSGGGSDSKSGAKKGSSSAAAAAANQYPCEVVSPLVRNPYVSMACLQSGTLANDVYRKSSYVVVIGKKK